MYTKSCGKRVTEGKGRENEKEKRGHNFHPLRGGKPQENIIDFLKKGKEKILIMCKCQGREKERKKNSDRRRSA